MSEPTSRPTARRRVRPWRLVAALTGLAAVTVLTLGVGSAQAQSDASAATRPSSYSGGGSGGPVNSILGVRWQ